MATPAQAPKKFGHRHVDKLMDICFDHTRGQCSRGDSCRFSHHLPLNGQIPPRPKTAGVCFDFTKGICKRGDACRFSHDTQAAATFNKGSSGGGPHGGSGGMGTGMGMGMAT
eukprot:CAMPEP_0181374198 /NCGR_PEP_ID=MMETSP1106-20121128/15868_1 /TAXON_ID=81844 /ORGANISM="Mantoniella antarctica, Strain SL-175" /LENGTH=111 /DNA_ID=CAMNT_0023492115 /DNA_START=138 /DNA_END=470 /DNA_ORIENTATION=+